MKGFKVTGHLTSAYAPSIDGVIHLDSLIAKAITLEQNLHYSQGEPDIIEIPALKLWEDENNKPLWSTTNIVPSKKDVLHKSVERWCKRFPKREVVDHRSKPNTCRSIGQYKNYIIPVQVQYCYSVEAYGIGDIERISELLQYITHIGKKPAQGKGRVIWQVEEWNGDEIKVENICMNRPIPMEFYQKMDKSKFIGKRWVMSRGAWTPPYWYRPWFSPCVTFKP